jgi:hypothetical protein
MQTTMKNLGAAALTAALLAGTLLVSSPAKADTAAAEATCKGKPAMKTRDWSSADVQKMSDADLAAIITNGKSPMPAYKTMTPDQVKDMVAYVRTFKK